MPEKIRFRFRCIVLAVACLWLGNVAVAERPARVINGAGSFVRVREGWKCTATQPKFVPPALRQLAVGDIVVRMGRIALDSDDPLVLAEGVRRAELGLISSAVVLRNGVEVVFSAPVGVPADGTAEIVVAQNSPEILRSTIAALPAGGRLEQIGGKSWESIENTFRANSATPFININFKPHMAARVRQGEQAVEKIIEEPVTLVGVRVPKLIGRDQELSRFLDGITLRGLNRGDAALKQTRGCWLLIHFWASWCKPCVLEAPSIAELATRRDLTVVALGYADSLERLKGFGGSVAGFPVYAPDANLTSELAVNGVPFDVLINPDGRAVAVISGTLPEGVVKQLVLSYLEP